MMQHAYKSVLFTLLFLNVISEIAAKPTQTEPEIHDNEIEIGENKISQHTSEYRARYAETMKTYMNETIDPCDDFYEYACGNWKNVIKERQSQNKRSNLLDIVYILGDAVEKLLNTSSENLNVDYASEFRLAQQFYQACLAADLYPLRKSSEYEEVIKSIGGFPAIDETWSAANFSWFNASAKMSMYGALGLLNEQILPQYPFYPYFKLPDLGFDYIVHSDNIASNTSRGYVLNEKRMREYLTTYGAEESKISQTIDDIFEFWRSVLNVTDQFDEDLDKCTEMKSETFTRWDDYFDIVWGGRAFNATEYNCPCHYFYVELDAICNENAEAVANYLAMKFLYRMDAKLQDTKFQKEFCVHNLHYSLPYLFDKMYLLEYFSQEIRDEITLLVNEVRKSLRSILEDADWLDESTREEALLKESTMVSRIGHFEDPEMTEQLIREMANLTFVEGNYAQSNLNLEKFKKFMKRYYGLHYEQLNNATKPLELLLATQVNAFYYNLDNSIYVMAGILHPPAYHTDWPNSLKYGTLGYLIGHELTHGFDSVGSQFDSVGEERYWWSSKAGKVFDERTNCYVDHYNKYLVPEINRNINGNQTKDENIADSGGLRESLSAYRRLMKELSKEVGQAALYKEEEMPSLDLTPEQLFFVGFAQLWCASYKEEHYWEELTNEHTMDKYRVLGAVTNTEEFAKIYDCPLGSKMNPKADKCRVW